MNKQKIIDVSDNKNALRYAKYKVTENELIFVKRILEYLCKIINDPGKHVYKINTTNSDILEFSLYSSFLVTYAKTFTSQKEGRNLQLNYKDVFKNKKVLKESHEKMIEERHKYIAHAGLSGSEIFKPLYNLEEKTLFSIQAKKITINNKETLEQYIKVIDHVIKHLKYKAQEAGDKFIEEYAQKQT